MSLSNDDTLAIVVFKNNNPSRVPLFRHVVFSKMYVLLSTRFKYKWYKQESAQLGCLVCLFPTIALSGHGACDIIIKGKPPTNLNVHVLRHRQREPLLLMEKEAEGRSTETSVSI